MPASHYRSAYSVALLAGAALVVGMPPTSAAAAEADRPRLRGDEADPPRLRPRLRGDEASPVQSSMQCDRASEPGRVRCTVEAHATGGRTVAWADVEILSLPDFASALKGRISPQDAVSRDASTLKWALGLVARRSGQGEVRARVRVVACEASAAGGEPRTRCTPIVVEVKAQVTVG